MKKIILGGLAGLLLGGAATWLFLRHAPAENATPLEKPAAAAEEKSESGVHLKKEQAEAAGLKTAASEIVAVPAEISAYGRVIDATPLLNTLAEIATAKAAAAATEKEYKRAKSLFDDGENAAAQTVEAAEAAMQRDRVTLLSAEARGVAAWGRGVMTKARIVAKALGEGATLLRIDVPPGENPSDALATAQVGPLSGGTKLFTVEILGAAPTADAQLQGTGYLALLRETVLPVGAALRATLAGEAAAEKFPVLPQSALVRHEGSVFVYVQTGEGRYERRRVELGATLQDKVAIKDGVEAKDQVVVVGAQQLLSAELGGSGETTEEKED